MTTRTALFIVDVQSGPVQDVPELAALPGRIRAHADATHYDLVVASIFRSRPGTAYARLVGQDMQDPHEVSLPAELRGIASLVVDSATYSSLTPDVAAALQEAEITEVVVVGLDTDQCVLATVFALFDAGYEPVVYEDLCASASGDMPHEAGLVALRRAIGEDRVRRSGVLVAPAAPGE